MTRKVALLIGVSEYGEGIPSLSAPVNDIEGMKRILENPKMGGFDDVKVLSNPDSINAMQTAVAEIFNNRGKEDLVLLYFSGHGITDDNNRLFLAIKGTSKNYYDATSVPASFIQNISQKCYAKRQVIILDCCYSGAFAEGWQTKSVGLDIQKELGAEGRVVLTSSSATQTSFQQEGEELSLYTKYFIEGIETGAADKQGTGKIYVHQIHDYAKGKVQEVKPKQKPDIILDKEAYNIILSQAPIDDPEADFRKLVEEYVKNREISLIGNRILMTKQIEWAIPEERASQIINEVLAPHRQYLANIKLYKEAYQEAVDNQYPLSTQFQDELQDYQDILGLKNEDVAKIKAEIQAKKENQNNPEKLANDNLKSFKKFEPIRFWGKNKQPLIISGTSLLLLTSFLLISNFFENQSIINRQQEGKNGVDTLNRSQQEGKNGVDTLNRSQQGYHFEKGEFASVNTEDLLSNNALGVTIPEEYYKFTTEAFNSDVIPHAFSTATPNQSGLKSYVGGIWFQSTTGTYYVIICESNQPSLSTPSPPTLVGNEPRCTSGLKVD